ncbi:hypothetical protein ACX80S_06590 [Arthrobacter sp. RHLT1-20]
MCCTNGGIEAALDHCDVATTAALSHEIHGVVVGIAVSSRSGFGRRRGR